MSAPLSADRFLAALKAEGLRVTEVATGARTTATTKDPGDRCTAC